MRSRDNRKSAIPIRLSKNNTRIDLAVIVQPPAVNWLNKSSASETAAIRYSAVASDVGVQRKRATIRPNVAIRTSPTTTSRRVKARLRT